MKVVVKREELISGLATAIRAVSLKATLPVLGNVCVSTEGNSLKLTATNLELGR